MINLPNGGIATEMTMDLEALRQQTTAVANELLAVAHLEKDDILVVG